jgi:hypothetical protein
MINVIVVPEINEYIKSTAYDLEVYINKEIGLPKLKENKAKYLAPFWLDEKNRGVDRIYHITGIKDNVIYLGNSFVLKKRWTNAGQTRKFEYHPLESFDFVEISDGLLINYDFNKKEK